MHPDPSTPNDDVLLQRLLDESLTTANNGEPILSLKRKSQERQIAHAALLICCFTAAMQLLLAPSLTSTLFTAFCFLAVAIPLLCLSILFERWQDIYSRHDYLQKSSSFGVLLLFTELFAAGTAITGILYLLWHVHPAISILFGAASVYSAVIFRLWRDSVTTKNHT